ncbi:MAG TPA: UPF0158 family protein [Saprospiraceae bacterium]|nr:UPF0158 family protein [Saprospiraceae bacterium]
MYPLSDDQIQEIAESFDMGLTCFWNKVTGELVFVPKREYEHLLEKDMFAEELEKIENNHENFIEIDPPSSSEQFQIMADFAEQLDERLLLRGQLITALNKSKQFQGFKHIIHNSGKYREQWFAYQTEQLQKFVRDSFRFILK